MKKTIIYTAAIALISWACAKNSGLKTNSTLAEDEATLATYSQYCSSCHGEKVEAFVDRKWLHGKTKDAIMSSITTGYVNAGMPSWQGTLSESQIENLATLIESKLATVDQYTFEEPVKEIYASEGSTVRLEKIMDGLDSPWGLTVLPDGSVLIADKNGTLHKVAKNGSKSTISGVPEVLFEGQGGLFDLELHPDFDQNQLIYLTFAKGKKEGEKSLATTAMVRAKLVDNTLTDVQEIFEALPYFETKHHYGGRMAFDKQGYLYVTVGDRGYRDENPQSLENYSGKVHRINDDGTVPADNPFVNTKGAVKSIWTYGHRNPQGLILDPTSGEIWETEHGPRGGDELNQIEKGKNYGWPVISYGINYDATVFTNITAKEGMMQPELYWIPSIAPCGMTYVSSDKYPAWKGDFLVGSLRFKYLNRCDMNNGKVVKEEKLLTNIGRLRNVFEGADGYIYVGVENPGVVYRLLPQ